MDKKVIERVKVERMKSIRTEIKRIENYLNAFENTKIEIDYGHIGNLGYIDEKLNEITEFLYGPCPE